MFGRILLVTQGQYGDQSTSFIDTKTRSKEHCIASYLFARRVYRLIRKTGILYTSMYLKQCSLSLQKAYGGDPSVSLLPVPVALTRWGTPPLSLSSIEGRSTGAERWRRTVWYSATPLSWFNIDKLVLLSIQEG